MIDMTGYLDIPVHQGAGLVVPLQWGTGTGAEDIEEFDLTGAVITLLINGTSYIMDALEIRLTAAQTANLPSPSHYVVVVPFPDQEPTHVLEGKLVGAHKTSNSAYSEVGYYAI